MPPIQVNLVASMFHTSMDCIVCEWCILCTIMVRTQ